MALYLITLTLYGLAWALFLVQLQGRRGSGPKPARWILVAALAVHLAIIGWHCVQHENPLRDLRGVLGLIAWLVGVGYLLATWRARLGGILGAFAVPLAICLLVVSRLAPSADSSAATTAHSLGHLHIALSALGVAAFGLAAAMAVIYLIQDGALKKRKLGNLFRRIPPLRTLDALGLKIIVVGFCLFTLAVVSGVLWMMQLDVGGAMWPAYAVSGGAWAVFGAMILLRATVGLRGRRAAWLTVAGFAAVVLVLSLYVARRIWGG